LGRLTRHVTGLRTRVARIQAWETAAIKLGGRARLRNGEAGAPPGGGVGGPQRQGLRGPGAQGRGNSRRGPRPWGEVRGGGGVPWSRTSKKTVALPRIPVQ